MSSGTSALGATAPVVPGTTAAAGRRGLRRLLREPHLGGPASTDAASTDAVLDGVVDHRLGRLERDGRGGPPAGALRRGGRLLRRHDGAGDVLGDRRDLGRVAGLEQGGLRGQLLLGERHVLERGRLGSGRRCCVGLRQLRRRCVGLGGARLGGVGHLLGGALAWCGGLLRGCLAHALGRGRRVGGLGEAGASPVAPSAPAVDVTSTPTAAAAAACSPASPPVAASAVAAIASAGLPAGAAALVARRRRGAFAGAGEPASAGVSSEGVVLSVGSSSTGVSVSGRCVTRRSDPGGGWYR
jgi:hypothetical protein